MPQMSYTKFGIRPEFVERVKVKMKNPVVKERIKQVVNGLTKYDLQDRVRVRRIVRQASSVLNEPLNETQEEQIVAFVLAQKIDPNNTLHLLKLWAMFR